MVRLRNEGFSPRKLAGAVLCGEGTIRNYEILGQVPRAAKQMVYDRRISMRRLVQLAREAQRRPESGSLS
jgi:hypothetical protein